MTQQQVLSFLKISKVTILEYRKKGHIQERKRNNKGELTYSKREILEFALNPPKGVTNRFPNQSREEVIRQFNKSLRVRSEKERLNSQLIKERDKINKTPIPLHKYPICKNKILRMHAPKKLKITEAEIDLLLAISPMEYFTINEIDNLYPTAGITTRKLIERKIIVPISTKNQILTTSRDAKVIIRNLYNCIFNHDEMYP